MTRYYSTHRPIGPGTIPNSPKPSEIHNFDSREYVDEIGGMAWGYADYKEPLDAKAADDYELVREKAKFKVHISTTARYTAELRASYIGEARDAAMRMFEEEDFGELADIDGRVSSIEDAEGNTIWQR